MKRTLRSLKPRGQSPAIALMVTLGIMALISVVILGNLYLIDDAMQYSRQTKRFNQNQALFKSFYTLMRQEAAKIDSPSSLDAFLVTLPELKDAKGLLELSATVSSLQGKVNINAIFDEDNTSLAPYYENMFHRLFEKYEVKNPDTLLALIADTIDSDNSERYGDSELVNRYADITQGRIVSSSHLKKIVAFYDEMFEDNTLDKIPWDRYFRFGKRHSKEIVDCNYLDRDLAFFMGLRRSLAGGGTMRCDEIGEDQNRTKADFNIEPFNKNRPYYLQVQTAYQALGLEGGFSFIFEIKDKEISHIQSY